MLFYFVIYFAVDRLFNLYINFLWFLCDFEFFTEAEDASVKSIFCTINQFFVEHYYGLLRADFFQYLQV